MDMRAIHIFLLGAALHSQIVGAIACLLQATVVAGRVLSELTVTDETSWVVKAPTSHQEEYVLNATKFEASAANNTGTRRNNSKGNIIGI